MNDPSAVPQSQSIARAEDDHREDSDESPWTWFDRRRGLNDALDDAFFRREVRQHGEGEGEKAHPDDHTDKGAEEEVATSQAVDEAKAEDRRKPVRDGDEESEGGGLGKVCLLYYLSGDCRGRQTLVGGGGRKEGRRREKVERAEW